MISTHNFTHKNHFYGFGLSFRLAKIFAKQLWSLCKQLPPIPKMQEIIPYFHNHLRHVCWISCNCVSWPCNWVTYNVIELHWFWGCPERDWNEYEITWSDSTCLLAPDQLGLWQPATYSTRSCDQTRLATPNSTLAPLPSATYRYTRGLRLLKSLADSWVWPFSNSVLLIKKLKFVVPPTTHF